MSRKEMPRYTSIAIDIAHNILNETFTIGSKITGRSTLSSKYGVSHETIRKAIALLKEMQVVDVNEKSGIIIKSKEMAYRFIDKYNAQTNIRLIHQRIEELRREKDSLEQKIDQHLQLLLDYTLKYEKTLTMSPDKHTVDTVQFELKNDDYIIGKSISETEFFKNTQSTIVSVYRDHEHILSPGPFFVFKPKDIVHFVCEGEHLSQVKSFIQYGSTTKS